MGLRLGIAGSPYDRGLTLSGSAYVRFSPPQSSPPTGPPEDLGITNFTNRASIAARRFVRSSSSPLGMGVNVLGAAQEEAIYSTPVISLGHATNRKGYTRVNLYYYQEGGEIFRGGVAGNARVCSVHPTICAFASHARKLGLSPGWYIQVPSTKGGLSFFRSPSVPEEEDRASVGSMDINRTTLDYGIWIKIFELVGRGMFDDKGGAMQFLMEDRKGDVDTGSTAYTLVSMRQKQCSTAALLPKQLMSCDFPNSQ